MHLLLFMDKKKPLVLGCVADDFTGASDAASFLVNQGIPTLLYNGIPKDVEGLKNCAAVVIALKTRSAPVIKSVQDTRDAFQFLVNHDTQHLYIKYCSTFDSTPQGNIGPNIDAMLEDLNLPYTLLCPSLPVNKRIVRGGILYVDGIPLSEGHMRHHPLNPMWDSSISKLMEPQGKYPCMVLDADVLKVPDDAVYKKVEEFTHIHPHCYLIPDYEDEKQGRRVAELFGNLRLLTGGSGLLAHLADQYKMNNDIRETFTLESKTSGRSILLAGSCSKATREQVRLYRDRGGKVLEVSPVRLLAGTQTTDEIWRFIQANDDPLLYSPGAFSEEKKETEIDPDAASARLEQVMAEIGRRAFDNGYTRIIVAGGETSGAVMLALGFDSFFIGPSVAPGVPVMIPVNHPNIRLILKSGNFGQPDFFERALNQTRG
jgi:uncharacterized protein YgbK (DUF1537 family)